jgi:hypothetical protein
MKVRVSFTVDINADAWATEYGIEPSGVRDDVKQYVEFMAEGHLERLGLLKTQEHTS